MSYESSQAAQASTNYKEAFSLFDKRGNGRVALDSLGDLLRACGQNPTLAEIADLEKSVGGDCETYPFAFAMRSCTGHFMTCARLQWSRRFGPYQPVLFREVDGMEANITRRI